MTPKLLSHASSMQLLYNGQSTKISFVAGLSVSSTKEEKGTETQILPYECMVICNVSKSQLNYVCVYESTLIEGICLIIE